MKWKITFNVDCDGKASAATSASHHQATILIGPCKDDEKALQSAVAGCKTNPECDGDNLPVHCNEMAVYMAQKNEPCPVEMCCQTCAGFWKSVSLYTVLNKIVDRTVSAT